MAAQAPSTSTSKLSRTRASRFKHDNNHGGSNGTSNVLHKLLTILDAYSWPTDLVYLLHSYCVSQVLYVVSANGAFIMILPSLSSLSTNATIAATVTSSTSSSPPLPVPLSSSHDITTNMVAGVWQCVILPSMVNGASLRGCISCIWDNELVMYMSGSERYKYQPIPRHRDESFHTTAIFHTSSSLHHSDERALPPSSFLSLPLHIAPSSSSVVASVASSQSLPRVRWSTSIRAHDRLYVLGGDSVTLAYRGVQRHHGCFDDMKYYPLTHINYGGGDDDDGNDGDNKDNDDRMHRSKWVRCQSMSVPRYQSTLAYANGCIYVFGGWVRGHGIAARNECYDIEYDEWATSGVAPLPYFIASAIAVTVTIMRPYLSSSKTTTTSTNTTPISSSPLPSSSSSSSSSSPAVDDRGWRDDIIVLLGGKDRENAALSTSIMYSIANDTWTPVAIPTPAIVRSQPLIRSRATILDDGSLVVYTNGIPGTLGSVWPLTQPWLLPYQQLQSYIQAYVTWESSSEHTTGDVPFESSSLYVTPQWYALPPVALQLDAIHSCA